MSGGLWNCGTRGTSSGNFIVTATFSENMKFWSSEDAFGFFVATEIICGLSWLDFFSNPWKKKDIFLLKCNGWWGECPIHGSTSWHWNRWWWFCSLHCIIGVQKPPNLVCFVSRQNNRYVVHRTINSAGFIRLEWMKSSDNAHSEWI